MAANLDFKMAAFGALNMVSSGFGFIVVVRIFPEIFIDYTRKCTRL